MKKEYCRRKPVVIKTISGMSKFIALEKKRGRSIGFVPTMGYLHKGHLSLIRAARRDTDTVVLSIFVNPTQFGPKEDYEKYPRDAARDLGLAEKEGAAALFMPSVSEIYPAGFRTYVELEDITERLCGRSRPGHFRGVATVVAKLLNMIRPDAAYFGQKDAQQAIVIKRMVKDLNMAVKIRVMPTVREPDGLAMSSRNAYLGGKERLDAAALFEALSLAKKLIEGGCRDAERVKAEMRKHLCSKKAVRIDYIAASDMESLKEVKELTGDALISLAVWIGNTRLIDNIVVGGKI